MKVFKIGRSSSNDIIINKESVSSQHAELRISDEKMVIHDNDSSNGVWINRRRIKSATFDFTDEVLIANQLIDIKKYLRVVNGLVIGAKKPDDFCENFDNLKTIETTFDEALDTQDKNANKMMILFRISFLITAVSGIVIRILVKEDNLKFILASTIVFGLISLYFFSKATKANQNKEKEKKILRDEHKTKYVCPNCNNFIPDSTYVMTLKEEYRCKFCKALLYLKSYIQ